jgi:UDP-N-acetyl-D-mannosaminuronic acid dehydrogenase
MPEALQLKPGEIDTNEKRGKYTVCVIGSEETGVLYATAFADAGFRVICTDSDQALVKSFSKGKVTFSNEKIASKLKSFLRRSQINVTNELQKAVPQSDIIVMTITANIDNKKHPDYSEVENACKQVGKTINRGTLFVYGGITGIGSTEAVVKETLENTSGFKVGEDFGLAYCPLRSRFQQPLISIADQQLKVAAFDGASLDSAAHVLGAISGKDVKRVSDVKMLEAALLFSIAKQDANLALANELAVFCEKISIDYFETLELVDVNDANFSPAVETEKTGKNEPYLLLESVERANAMAKLPILARKINEDMIRHAVNLTRDALRSCGKTLRRAKVAVLGTAKKKTATTIFFKMLERRGAKARLYDPLVSKNEFADVARLLKRSLKEAVEGTDCVVLLTEHAQFKRLNFRRLRAMMKIPAAIVDLIGIIEPEKVERQGFAYRGLGRGEKEK